MFKLFGGLVKNVFPKNTVFGKFLGSNRRSGTGIIGKVFERKQAAKTLPLLTATTLKPPLFAPLQTVTPAKKDNNIVFIALAVVVIVVIGLVMKK